MIAGKAFQSRLIVGTGKYKDGRETQAAIEASGAEMVTVAVRRVNLDRSKESLLDFIDPQRYFLLPNTAGCYTADEAIRAARLGREVGLSDWVKIEVIGDQATLYPDVQATLEATRVLVKEGFTVLPYTSDDIVFVYRCGCWDGFGRGDRYGTRCRCGIDEYRDCSGAETGADGRGDVSCSAGRAASLLGRKNAAEALCDGEFAA